MIVTNLLGRSAVEFCDQMGDIFGNFFSMTLLLVGLHDEPGLDNKPLVSPEK